MRHLPFLAVMTAAAATSYVALPACSSTTATSVRDDAEDAAPRRDGGVVTLPEGGAADAAPPPDEPSCETYCALATTSCTGDFQQYRSKAECLAICKLLPLGTAGDEDTSSVACRQHYAGSPARTDAVSYCVAAGPFGGNVCGDRCTAFCQIALAACSPDAGSAPYASYADCQTACADYAYRAPDAGDAGDAGGETPFGPTTGDSLNCRLFHLREAVMDATSCADIAAKSDACK